MSRRLPLIISLVLFALATGVLTASASSPKPQSTQSPQAAGSNGSNAPDATCASDGQCFADVLPANPFYAFINRIYQQDLVSGYPCGGPGEPCDPEGRPYYRPVNNVTRQQMAKFIDNARRLPGIEIITSTAAAPVRVFNNSTAPFAISVYGNSPGATGIGMNGIGGQFGVYGQSGSGYGVSGMSNQSFGGVFTSTNSTGLLATGHDIGVEGFSDFNTGTGVSGSGFNGVIGAGYSGYGVIGSTSGGAGKAGVAGVGVDAAYGVQGISDSGYAGVYGQSSASIGGTGVIGVADGAGSAGVYGRSSGGLAGYFNGNVSVTGSLSKGAGSFKIDDPIDPANKYLYHSFVESPDMMDIYNGNVTTDANGEATVTMPTWFDALNRDFRYQLTPIGQFAQAMVSQELTAGQFKIETDKPNVKVSWQVTGIRQDPYATAHRIPVEEDKPADEKGKYLYPTEYGQPQSSGINYQRDQMTEQPLPSPR